MVKYLKCKDALIKDSEGGLSLDDEDDSIGVKPETRAVLTRWTLPVYVYFLTYPHVDRNGEFCSWKSLFFYCCTDTISFTPLPSQGSECWFKYARKMAVADAPPSCSPKAVYVLASLVRQ